MKQPEKSTSAAELRIFSDTESAEAALEETFCRIKVTPGKEGRFRIRDVTRKLSKIIICQQSFDGTTWYQPDGSPEFLAITRTLRGHADLTLNKYDVSAGCGDGFMTSPDRSTQLRWSESSSVLTVKIRMADLLESLRVMTGLSAPNTLEFHPFMAKDNAQAQAWWTVVEALQKLARQPGAELASAEYEDFLIAALLRGQPHSFNHLRESPNSHAAPIHVKKAIDYIEAHLDQPILLADLVAVSGVSAGALNSGFQKFRDLSPMTYVRERRLVHVKAQLEQNERNVTEAALEAGFTHLGRFSKFYTQKFGEKPSDTLRRSRISGFSVRNG